MGGLFYWSEHRDPDFMVSLPSSRQQATVRTTVAVNLSNRLIHLNKKVHPVGGLSYLVGASGFEPEASWTRTKRDTKLRHAPIAKIL